MYSLELTETAKKFLKKCEKKETELILNKLQDVRENPFHYLKRLQGEKLWRLRVANYRVILDVIISGNKIVVLRIGHRKNVYN